MSIDRLRARLDNAYPVLANGGGGPAPTPEEFVAMVDAAVSEVVDRVVEALHPEASSGANVSAGPLVTYLPRHPFEGMGPCSARIALPGQEPTYCGERRGHRIHAV